MSALGRIFRRGSSGRSFPAHCSLDHFRLSCSPIQTLRSFPQALRSSRAVSTIPTCPPASCSCREMPPGLDINHKLPLANTMPAYHQHLLIPTGRTDWTSRIEEDEGLKAVKDIKEMLGPKGEFSNPFHNVMITASSHSPSSSGIEFSAILLPKFQYISSTTSTSEDLRRFIQAFVLPSQLDDRMPNKESDHAVKLVQKPELQDNFSSIDIKDIVVLICGHNSRDSRCGILGPLLADEFTEKLNKTLYKVKKDFDQGVVKQHEESGSTIAQISHIGGHKFAGNVIVYIPPTLTEQPLAGSGIWYGRVEPKHVEGIVKKTIEEGVIIEDLFRGGVRKDGSIIRL